MAFCMTAERSGGPILGSGVSGGGDPCVGWVRGEVGSVVVVEGLKWTEDGGVPWRRDKD